MTVKGRPTKGKEAKIVKSIRVEPYILAKIEKKYGSIQKFIDGIIYGDIHPYHNYITIKTKDRRS